MSSCSAVPGGVPPVRRCAWRAGALLAVLATLAATDAAAQTGCLYLGWCAVTPDRSMRAADHVRAGAINAALGGVTAGMFNAARGEPFLPAFVGGAAGGTVSYSGKLISGQHWSGAGLIGRELAALGSSMVGNASQGRGMLERVVLPVGPMTLHVDRADGMSVRAKLDVLATLFTTYALAHPDYALDWSASASSGAPVFHARSVREGRPWRGGMVAGSILMQSGRYDPAWRQVRAHEQVHVAQHDFSAIAWGAPFEDWLLRRVPRGEWIGRRFDLGVDFLFWAGLYAFASQRGTPWEREARFLSGQ